MKNLPLSASLILFAAILSCYGAPARQKGSDAGGDIQILKKTAKAFSSVAKKAIPAVVFIKVEKANEFGPPAARGPWNDPFDLYGDDLYDRFFGGRGPGMGPQLFQGSGFIISKDGYILTNSHVARNADKLVVKLHDGKEFDAKCIGIDLKSEIAVIKIEGKDFPVIELGDSEEVEIGEWVIAVGNPFGLTETLTVGVVSAKGRSQMGLAEYEDFIQTDAAINPGNSGGPLLNIEGKAIGITTAIISQTGGHVGISFAIPINMAKVIKDQLVAKGKVIRGFLGVQLNPGDISEEMAQHFGLKKAAGALVADVVKDSPAEKAGLKAEDVILKMDGKDVENGNSFRNTVALITPGTKVSLVVFRDGAEKKFEIAVGAFPEGKDQAVAAVVAPARKLGLTVQDFNNETAEKMGYDSSQGVLVTTVEPDSAAARAGIRRGTLVMSVNRKPVNSAAEFNEEIAKATANKSVLLKMKDQFSSRFVLVKIE